MDIETATTIIKYLILLGVLGFLGQIFLGKKEREREIKREILNTYTQAAQKARKNYPDLAVVIDNKDVTGEQLGQTLDKWFDVVGRFEEENKRKIMERYKISERDYERIKKS